MHLSIDSNKRKQLRVFSIQFKINCYKFLKRGWEGCAIGSKNQLRLQILIPAEALVGMYHVPATQPVIRSPWSKATLTYLLVQFIFVRPQAFCNQNKSLWKQSSAYASKTDLFVCKDDTCLSSAFSILEKLERLISKWQLKINELIQVLQESESLSKRKTCKKISTFTWLF